MRSLMFLRLGWVALLLLLSAVPGGDAIDDDQWVPEEEYLVRARVAIEEEDSLTAIDLLEQGLRSLATKDDESLYQSNQLTIKVRLEATLGWTLVSISDQPAAFRHYDAAIEAYDAATAAVASVDASDYEEATRLISKVMTAYAKQLEDDDETKAYKLYRKAVNTNPALWNGWLMMARFLERLGDVEKAIEAFRKCYEVMTEHPSPTDPIEDENENKIYLSYLQQAIAVASCEYDGINHPEKPTHCEPFAIEALKKAIEIDPTNIDAKQVLAVVEGEKDGSVHPEALHYREFFDDFAVEYDEKMTGILGYQANEILRRGFDKALGGQEFVETFPVVLDAGCGTGLTGVEFRNVSTHLIGVDFSEAMVEEGKKLRPDLYDEIIVGDLIQAIQAKQPIDLIVAADTFIYFGEMGPLFAAISKALTDNGFVAFTLEHAAIAHEAMLDQTNPDWTYQITQAMRFAHRKDYVDDLAPKYGLAVYHKENIDGFRQEMSEDVRGDMYLLQKKPTNNMDEL